MVYKFPYRGQIRGAWTLKRRERLLLRPFYYSGYLRLKTSKFDDMTVGCVTLLGRAMAYVSREYGIVLTAHVSVPSRSRVFLSSAIVALPFTIMDLLRG